jgi:hypothetical protein
MMWAPTRTSEEQKATRADIVKELDNHLCGAARVHDQIESALTMKGGAR